MPGLRLTRPAGIGYVVRVSTEALSLLIALVGFICSVLGATFLSGTRWAEVRADIRRNSERVSILEGNQGNLATKEQLADVKSDLAEIKGMFRMTLREPAEHHQN